MIRPRSGRDALRNAVLMMLAAGATRKVRGIVIPPRFRRVSLRDAVLMTLATGAPSSVRCILGFRRVSQVQLCVTRGGSCLQPACPALVSGGFYLELKPFYHRVRQQFLAHLAYRIPRSIGIHGI